MGGRRHGVDDGACCLGADAGGAAAGAVDGGVDGGGDGSRKAVLLPARSPIVITPTDGSRCGLKSGPGRPMDAPLPLRRGRRVGLPSPSSLTCCVRTRINLGMMMG